MYNPPDHCHHFHKKKFKLFNVQSSNSQYNFDIDCNLTISRKFASLTESIIQQILVQFSAILHYTELGVQHLLSGFKKMYPP